MLKTNKILKRLMCITLACVLMVVGVVGASSFKQANAMAVNSANDEEISLEGLVAVVVYENEDESMIAYVPKENVEEYTYRLENEEGYRESQIEAARCSSKTTTRCTKPSGGLLNHTVKMYEQDIRNYLIGAKASLADYDRAVNSTLVNFIAFVSGFVKPYGAVISIAKFILGDFAVSAAGGLNSWWEQALYETARGEINGVCCCTFQNVASEYPKVWSLKSKF